MIFGSICSGVEAASLAWEPLGWRPAFFSEIADFPSRVLAHRWPDVPNLGDFTTIDIDQHPIEVLVGGTPCQAFSLAGARRSLDDARGNLTLQFVNLIHAAKHLRYAVWENVPGVLSTKDNAFGCFLAGLVGADDALHLPKGRKWPDVGMASGPLGRTAWRVFDAQYFRLPQRRRRVFLVFCPAASSGDPVEILFERQGVHGNSPPRRQQELPPSIDLDENSFPESWQGGVDIAHTLRAEGFDASEDGTGRGTPLVAICFSAKDYGGDAAVEIAPTLRAGGHAETWANAGVMPAVTTPWGVRRLMPIECERLQGLPDNHTRLPVRTLKSRPTSKHFWKFSDLYEAVADVWIRFVDDGPRYKAIGNSMPVAVMRWIGERIHAQASTLPR